MRSTTSGAAGVVGGASSFALGQDLSQESLQALPHRQRASGWQLPPLASSLPSLSSEHLLLRTRPTTSAVEVDAEAEARAAQVDRVEMVVREPEAQVAQRDGTSHVDQVVLVGVRLHACRRSWL